MTTSWKSTHRRYGWLPMAFHWLMLLLIVAVYATMDLKSIYPRGSAPRAALASWHFMLGLSVFMLVWLRLLVRSQGDEPSIEPPLPKWQAVLAKILHLALYALMIGLPLLGWLTLSARGTPIPFYGLELPALVEKSENLARLFKDMHESAASVGYFLIAAHSAAALYHHYVRRDNTLTRMLPGR